MKVDAHQHFWRLSRGDYRWLTPGEHSAIYRDFMPDALKLLLERAGIDRTILIQAAPTEAETSFLLEVAASVPFVAGVVGWTDFEARDAPDRIARLAANKRLLGLRPMLQDIPDAEWILSATVSPAVAAMKEQGLRFDALIKLRHLDALMRFIAFHPDLPIVIDHAAKPDIASGALRDWKRKIRLVAMESAACCKLSGLVTEAGPAWTTEALKPVFEILLDCFGPRRLMWGSDWPVVNAVADYTGWHAAAHELAAQLAPSERDAIFGGTAAHFYGVSG